jgi:hypothetical protein
VGDALQDYRVSGAQGQHDRSVVALPDTDPIECTAQWHGPRVRRERIGGEGLGFGDQRVAFALRQTGHLLHRGGRDHQPHRVYCR